MFCFFSSDILFIIFVYFLFDPSSYILFDHTFLLFLHSM